MEEKSMILLQEILNKGPLFPIDTSHFFQSFLLCIFTFFTARYFLKTKELNSFHDLTVLVLSICGLLSILSMTAFPHIILRPSISYFLKRIVLMIGSTIIGYFLFSFLKNKKGQKNDA